MAPHTGGPPPPSPGTRTPRVRDGGAAGDTPTAGDPAAAVSDWSPVDDEVHVSMLRSFAVTLPRVVVPSKSVTSHWFRVINVSEASFAMRLGVVTFRGGGTADGDPAVDTDDTAFALGELLTLSVVEHSSGDPLTEASLSPGESLAVRVTVAPSEAAGRTDTWARVAALLAAAAPPAGESSASSSSPAGSVAHAAVVSGGTLLGLQPPTPPGHSRRSSAGSIADGLVLLPGSLPTASSLAGLSASGGGGSGGAGGAAAAMGTVIDGAIARLELHCIVDGIVEPADAVCVYGSAVRGPSVGVSPPMLSFATSAAGAPPPPPKTLRLTNLWTSSSRRFAIRVANLPPGVEAVVRTVVAPPPPPPDEAPAGGGGDVPITGGGSDAPVPYGGAGGGGGSSSGGSSGSGGPLGPLSEVAAGLGGTSLGGASDVSVGSAPSGGGVWGTAGADAEAAAAAAAAAGAAVDALFASADGAIPPDGCRLAPAQALPVRIAVRREAGVTARVTGVASVNVVELSEAGTPGEGGGPAGTAAPQASAVLRINLL
ncbi:hypothetical protein BU14_0457s0008 [Porphyra umbilicalis]|uniref:Uncharacterized protein n=1 Tax=Porphyra umbilicalis TaxID=2786 RepID=A0A1X6NUH2_PORUM|nr:hypothetical protein BU14_0457s0008 [Porphyra umbilicalis]|eukprot:OSX72215.1 hypothetical protein BU14_0457s0008 [Porphyra umbilicalis]